MQLDKTITNDAGIYKITNNVNGKFYIGSSINIRKRLCGHICSLLKNKHYNYHLQRAFNKYTINNFKFEIVEIVPTEEITDKKYLTDIEQLYLDAYQPYEKDNGYNICPEAANYIKITQTKEGKEKSRLARLGYKKTPEQIEKTASAVRKIYNFISPEGKEVIITNLIKFCKNNNLNVRGMQEVHNKNQVHHKHWTIEETRNEYLNQIEKYPEPPFYVISPEGVEYEVFNIAEFSRIHNLVAASLNRIIRKTRKQYKGWTVKDNG